MTIRPAQPGDAAAICAIWNRVIRDTAITFTTEEKTPDALAETIAARGDGFVVAEEAGGIAGFATISPFRSGPGYAHTLEHTIHLAPDARGRGLGRALMTRLETVAAGQGAHCLIAAISGANPDAVRFHAAMGFATVGRLPETGFKGGQWLDLILMQKFLHQGQ